jgi:hypothetical protein
VPQKQKHDDSSTLFIYLHALTNEGCGWSHSAPLPAWALEMASIEELSCKIPGYLPPCVHEIEGDPDPRKEMEENRPSP